MRIIERKILSNFCRRHADAEGLLVTWRERVKKAGWKNPAELKKQYGSASTIGNNGVVFNIEGNTYRLVAEINYTIGVVNVCFLGTHAEYDAVDAKTVRHG